MNTRFTSSRALLFPFVVTLSLATGACDNPVEDEEHPGDEASSVVIEDPQGTVIASMDRNRNVTGSITVRNGQEREIRVVFRAEDGDRIEATGELSLRGTMANTGIASWTQIANTGGRVAGRSVGTTSITFDLLHGGHPDFSSQPIPVTVTP